MTGFYRCILAYLFLMVILLKISLNIFSTRVFFSCRIFLKKNTMFCEKLKEIALAMEKGKKKSEYLVIDNGETLVDGSNQLLLLLTSESPGFFETVVLFFSSLVFSLSVISAWILSKVNIQMLFTGIFHRLTSSSPAAPFPR